MIQIKQSEIWKRILKSEDLDEISFLLHLIIDDEDSIDVILSNFNPSFTNMKVNISLD